MARKKKRIVVTQQDINNGQPCTYDSCPVAIAVRRAFRIGPLANRTITVKPEIIGIGEMQDDTTWVAYTTPQIERFIRRFDKNQPVKPFTAVVEFR